LLGLSVSLDLVVGVFKKVPVHRKELVGEIPEEDQPLRRSHQAE
jgi:hypothetical protein